jgi:hypothetical protein
VDVNKKVLCRAEQISIFKNARECTFALDTQSAGPISLVPVGIKSSGAPIDLKLDGAISRIKNAAADRAAADAKAAADRAAADAKAAADRAAADAKAAADRAAADAKAAADRAAADAKAAADKVAAVKKITITCIKGKVTKKVTGTKPKCPSGFKRK